MWSSTEPSLNDPVCKRALASIEQLFRERDPREPRIFYCCYAGTHASVVVGWCHLGRRPSTCQSIADLPFFDRRLTEEIGSPILLGTDGFGGHVYALGTGVAGKELEMALVRRISQRFPQARAIFFNVRAVLDVRSRIGGFLSRRMGMVRAGRSLVARSLYRRLRLVEAVVQTSLDLERKWRDNEGQSNGEVLWLDAGDVVRRRSETGFAGESCRPGRDKTG
ncbi:MAG TPA: DUF3189 family protein [Firmicutes bacterium]|nr:DUF3189 family protein [Candidatus Fermentithermobacillaceae bacterium]